MTELPPPGRPRANLYDVARAADVSHTTVSRVLNGYPRVKEATRRRVLEAIDAVNFTPSSIARALATQRAMRIGVVVHNASHFGPNSTLIAFERAAREQGYAVSVLAQEDEELETGVDVHELVAQGIDALCLIAPRDSSLLALRRHGGHVPTLAIKSEPDDELYTAAVDQHAGAVLAVGHLVALGHRSIAHVSGPLDWYDGRARAEGWRDVLAEARLPADALIVGDWTSDFGYAVGRDHDFGGATAVFAANDQMALGLLHGLADRGVRVPAEMSVVGFDDLPDARHYRPPLTTIRQDFERLGRLALHALVSAMQENPIADYQVIEPQLVVRGSTAPPRF